jgi:hypothetical protein
MIVAVFFIFVTIALVGWPSSVLLFHRRQGLALTSLQELLIGGGFAAAALLSIGTWLFSMRIGVKALDGMGGA